MIKVGVTGGIGSGKTTFCNVWEQLGAYVVYADDLAKNLMISDESIVSRIKETFGIQSYNIDGSLNRAHLAAEAFSKGRVDELNAIVHPILWSRIEDLASRKEEDGIQIFVKEAAILLQNGRPKDLDYIVLINANQADRIERVIKRDHTSKDLIIDRINNQQSFEEAAHLADYIVSNDSGENELIQKAKDLFKLIISRK